MSLYTRLLIQKPKQSWCQLLSRDGAIMYRVLRKPRHCDGPYDVGDTVTMNMWAAQLCSIWLILIHPSFAKQGVPWFEQRWRGGGNAACPHNKDWKWTGIEARSFFSKRRNNASHPNSQYGLPWARDSWGCVLGRRGGFLYLRRNWGTSTKRYYRERMSSFNFNIFPFADLTRHPWDSSNVSWGWTYRHQQDVAL